ncbi:unnamed protein product [Menidia menidia]|uniref:(Atlantic silverside) hypothetical protein n=1 Tax=Menidia menidia TaxID=238744 RepID=A0A8S4BYP6_9TELE|nr:unnamed protein product [Menidia menidia]
MAKAVEVFIRDKYERKKYYDKDAVATAPEDSGSSAQSSPVWRCVDISDSIKDGRGEREALTEGG